MAIAPDPALTNGTTDATPAPQPTPAQPQAGMPGQAASQAITPAASAPAASAPAASAPAASAPAQGTQPQAAATAQAAAVPSTEATINAASTGRGATGILRGILVGALKGASAHLIGHPASAPASAPQPARQGGVVSAIGQGLKKVGQGVGHEASTFLKAQPAYQERMKDAQDMQIKANVATLQAHHMMLENQELTGKVADEEQARTDKKTADQKAQQDAWQGLHDQFEKEGIKADYAHGPGHDNMGQSHAADAAAGTTVHAYNGETGADAGVDIYNVQELQNSLLTADFSTPVTFDIDPKTGDIINVKNQTLRAGSATAWQAHQLVQDYSARVAKAQADWTAAQNRRKLGAEAQSAQDKNADTLTQLENKPEMMAGDKASSVVAMAQRVATDPSVSPADKVRWQRIGAQAAQTQKLQEQAKTNQARVAEAAKDGDPNQAGMLLATGVGTPAELLSNRKPEFATAAIAAANKYAKEHGAPEITPGSGVYWSAGKAAAQAKIAGNEDSVRFFRNANSLTDPDTGTLVQLEKLGNSLPQGKIPVLNKWSDLVNLESGDPQVAAFKAMALGVADDYGQLMGAGATDSARNTILSLTDPKMSPAQRAAVLAGMRYAVESKKRAAIGTNPYLQNMYGGNTAPAPQTGAGNPNPFGATPRGN